MNRFIKKLLALSFLVLLPAIGFANGEHTPGVVTITTTATSVVMSGAYNVRHNPGVTTGSVNISQYTDGSIVFTMKDSVTGIQDVCLVYEGTPLHPRALEAMRISGNGAWYQVRKNINSGDAECYSLAFQKRSNSID